MKPELGCTGPGFSFFYYLGIFNEAGHIINVKIKENEGDLYQ